MPLISWGSNKSWSAQAREPKCSPSKSEMTLMEAAREMGRINRKDMQKAEKELRQAESSGNAKGIKAAKNDIKKIKGRK